MIINKNMKKFYFYFFIFIYRFIFTQPFNLYYFAKNYKPMNSDVVLEFFEANLEDLNKQDENGDTPLHIHIRYLLNNMYDNIDLNLLNFLAKNGDLQVSNKKFELPINMILDKFYNLEEYKSHFNYDEENIRIKLFAFLNCLLSENWHIPFQGLSFLKKMGCEYFHDHGFYNITLFLLNKISFNILYKGLPIYKNLKKIFIYEKNAKSDFLRNLYHYSYIIDEFYNY